MPAKKYIVELDAGERELLTGFISTGKASATVTGSVLASVFDTGAGAVLIAPAACT